MQPLAEQGYVILATNTDTVDYVECAVRLASSIKFWAPGANVCLITDHDSANPVFDHVRVMPTVNVANPWANDAQVFRLTPYRETIKLEADMLITSDISSWWDTFRHRDLVLSLGCKNWRGDVSTARQYRRVFDANQLPDVYNAITYWRLSNTAQEFFTLVQNIFTHWPEYQKLLKFPDETPSTDLVYAMAAQIIGPSKVTVPGAPQITHMKRHIAGTRQDDWTRELVWEYHEHKLRINTLAQWGAFHYNIKNWKP